eukprot:1988820-Rhodomonas_salina.1
MPPSNSHSHPPDPFHHRASRGHCPPPHPVPFHNPSVAQFTEAHSSLMPRTCQTGARLNSPQHSRPMPQPWPFPRLAIPCRLRHQRSCPVGVDMMVQENISCA